MLSSYSQKKFRDVLFNIIHDLTQVNKEFRVTLLDRYLNDMSVYELSPENFSLIYFINISVFIY